MITNKQIRQIIKDCDKAGYKIRLRDISYVLLTKSIEDKQTIYTMLFGADKDFNEEYANTFDNTLAIAYLRDYMEFNYYEKKSNTKKDDKDISFEENKAEIIKLIEDTQQALKEGSIKTSDALKIQADLRVKLNDKFNVAEELQEQIVVVNTKYNAICPTCGHETYIPTKEDLMNEYNLIEKE